MKEKKKEESQKKLELLNIVKMDINQTLLLKQQLRQHVQLLTQHYLQTYGHPVLHYLASELKLRLVSILYSILPYLTDNTVRCYFYYDHYIVKHQYVQL